MRTLPCRPPPVSYTHLDVYKRQAEGQEKLKEAHKALWNFFGNVAFDQNNPRAWVAFFEKDDAAESEKLRKEFYEKLAAFSKMMTMAVGNYSLYQSIGFDQMQNYKACLLYTSRCV